MPSLSVDIHPEAIAEAQAATQWYRERSLSAAAAYLAELDSAVAAIAENPEMWPRYAHSTPLYSPSISFLPGISRNCRQA